MNRYLAIFTFHDDAITVEMADFPGFFVQADTTKFDQAIAEAEDVLADYTGTILEQDGELPIPSDFLTAAKIAKERGLNTPDGPRQASVVLNARPRYNGPVRINLSLDSTSLAKIDEAADRRGLTRSAYLTKAALEYN